MKKKRILFYSHDTFGLGHIRRTQKIANQLAGPDTAILILCSSPKASEYKSQQGIEYLNLPGFTKLQSGKYIPRNMNLSIDEFVKIRSELILAAVKSFDPEVVVVDKEPLGVKGELKRTLEYLRMDRPEARTVCGIRDILDQPDQVKSEWEKRGSKEALRKFYDGILIYGDKEIYDLERQYSLEPDIAAKLRYVGYILETRSQDLQHEPTQLLPESDVPLVTFSLGGGEDGYAFLQTYIQMLKQYRNELKFRSMIVTGPFLQNGEFQSAKDEILQLGSVASIENFVPNMVDLFSKSQGLVTMGGYNTFCECMSLKKIPLILPRIVPRQEQLIRAQIFSQLGLCHYLHPDDISPETLLKMVKKNLELNQKPVQEFSEGRGLEKTAQYLSDMLRSVHLRRHGWVKSPSSLREPVSLANDQVCL